MEIRFLVEGDQSGGSVAVFEFDVPAGLSVAAAHSHDGYEETIYGLEGVLTWTVEGTPIDVGPGQVLCIPAAPSTSSTTPTTSTPRRSRSSPLASSAPATSAKLRPSSMPPRTARPTSQRWGKSCADTDSPVPNDAAPAQL
jgi:Cupin domain